MKRPIEKELNRLEPDKAVINELERSVDRLDEVLNKLDDVSSRVSAIEIPSEVTVSNFPDPEPYPEFPDFPEFPTKIQAEVTNFPAQVFPKVQKVEVLNQVEIPEQKEVQFPEVQKVEVLNFPVHEKMVFPEPKEVVFPEVQKSILVDSDGEEIDFEKISEKLGKTIASVPQFVGAGGGTSTGIAKEETLQLGVTEQTSQTAIQTVLASLADTLQELVARLEVIAGMANSGPPALRVTPIASVSTAVTGTLTSVGTLTNFGAGIPAKEIADDANNFTAILANINNTTT